MEKYQTLGGRTGHYEDLKAIYDDRNNFYGKAEVFAFDDGEKVLRSFSRDIIGKIGTDPSEIYRIEQNEAYLTQTTKRHVREFVRQYGDYFARNSLESSVNFNDYYNELPTREEAVAKNAILSEIRGYNGVDNYEDLEALGYKISRHAHDNCGVKNIPVMEGEDYKLSVTGREYDFVGLVENKTNEPLAFSFSDNSAIEPFCIEPNGWFGLSNYAEIGAIASANFELNNPDVVEELGMNADGQERD